MMFNTQEKLNLSKKIEDINKTYVETLEKINEKISQRTE